MRLLTLAYPAAADFLAAYDDASRTLVAHTKTEAEIGENVLVEIAFPNLPNRPLLRANCCGLVSGGLRLELDDADAETRDFLVKIARGEPFESTHRANKRIPTTLPVEFEHAGAKVKSHVEDLSSGGCFVRADHPPPIGATILLEVSPPDDTTPMQLKGVVAWVREGKEPGFGVEFDGQESADGRRLRTLLRRAIGSGEVDL